MGKSDMEKVIKGLEEISDYFFSVYHHAKDREEIIEAKDRCDAVENALALLKEQKKRINELEEKLRLLEYGDQDILKSGLRPAT